jgi:hypothetical protein
MNFVRTTTNHMSHSRKQPTSTGTVRLIVIVLCFMAFVGMFFSAFLIPSESNGGPSTNSLISDASRGLNDRIHKWLPEENSHFIKQESILPDWSKEIWTPIDVDVSEDPMIVLCRLNFKQYWEKPHSSPMFRDLEGMSSCIGSNRRREKLSVLMADIQTNQNNSLGRIVKPTGFVFHESRVGSTLVANLLATDPYALVFSESTPLANAILHCHGCTRERHVQLFRDVMTLMGRSPIHNKLFAKFQSITTTKISIVLEAFPDTPWAFIFRQPVQTMMSHLDPSKGASSAPCLRSKRSPPVEVIIIIIIIIIIFLFYIYYILYNLGEICD